MIPSIFKKPILVIMLLGFLFIPDSNLSNLVVKAQDRQSSLQSKVNELDKEIAILKVTLEERDVALALQAKEYERRLELLNHEADRVKEVQDAYVLKSDAAATEKARIVALLDESQKREVSDKEINDKIQILTSFKDNFQGQQAVMTVAISFGVTLIGLGANYAWGRSSSKKRVSTK